MARLLLSSALVLLLALLSGCGGGEADAPSANGSDESSSDVEIKRVNTKKLPKLGDYLPPLPPGEGVVEVAPPEGWSIKPQNAAYLCAFSEEKGQNFPAIVVKRSEPSVGEFEDDVTEKNLAEFVEAVQGTLKNRLEDAVGLIIGDHAFARYVKTASVNNLPAELQVLVTIKSGKMYTIELRVKPDELTRHRDHAYAVAGGMKFSNGAPPESTESKPTDEAKTE